MKLSFVSLGLPLVGLFAGAISTPLESRAIDLPTFLQQLDSKAEQTAAELR